MAKIFIAATSFGKDTRSLLENSGRNEVLFNTLGRKLASLEIIKFASDSAGIIAGTEEYSREVLQKFSNLKAISRCGAGVDNIDLAAAKEMGIKVFNTPDAPTLAVAELAVGLMLNLLRGVSLTDRQVRNGIWLKYTGNLLKGKNIGIVGFGRIGRKVAELLCPFAVHIAYYDINIKDANSAYTFKPMWDLLAWADIITLHCPPEKAGKRFLAEKELARMKSGSYLINTSRGGLIDESALYNSIKEGHLSAAALDVFQDEPYKGKLAELNNVILTPHIGSYAQEARIEMERQAVVNILKGLEGV